MSHVEPWMSVCLCACVSLWVRLCPCVRALTDVISILSPTTPQWYEPMFLDINLFFTVIFAMIIMLKSLLVPLHPSPCPSVSASCRAYVPHHDSWCLVPLILFCCLSCSTFCHSSSNSSLHFLLMLFVSWSGISDAIFRFIILNLIVYYPRV